MSSVTRRFGAQTANVGARALPLARLRESGEKKMLLDARRSAFGKKPQRNKKNRRLLVYFLISQLIYWRRRSLARFLHT